MLEAPQRFNSLTKGEYELVFRPKNSDIVFCARFTLKIQERLLGTSLQKFIESYPTWPFLPFSPYLSTE